MKQQQKFANFKRQLHLHLSQNIFEILVVYLVQLSLTHFCLLLISSFRGMWIWIATEKYNIR